MINAFSTQFTFSNREKEVFRLIIGGHSNAEIAGDLFISENTVKFHIKNILKKTQCSNRTELIQKIGKCPCSKHLNTFYFAFSARRTFKSLITCSFNEFG